MSDHPQKKEIERLRAALEEIANPIAAMEARAKADGMRLNGGGAVALSNDPNYLKQIARDALGKAS